MNCKQAALAQRYDLRVDHYLSINDEVFKLFVKLLCALLLVIGQLNGLTEVKAENTEYRLAVYLIFAGFKVNVTLEAYEYVHQLINVVDLSEFDIKSHFDKFLSMI